MGRPTTICVAGLLAALLAGVLASPAAGELKPRITKFCFDNATKEITFFAMPGKKDGFSYSLTSSSNQTVFQPAITSGSFGGVVGGGSTWTITPGGAAAGEVHTFTISCTNENGTSSSTLGLNVVAGGPSEYAAGTPGYGEGDVCAALLNAPGASPGGLLVAAVVMLGLGGVLLRRRRAVLGMTLQSLRRE